MQLVQSLDITVGSSSSRCWMDDWWTASPSLLDLFNRFTTQQTHIRSHKDTKHIHTGGKNFLKREREMEYY